jgi:hypothetical protein
VSALRISVPGKKPVLILLGHEEPVPLSDRMERFKRVPLEDRIGRRVA